jgi:2'-5' RNA ligase
LANWFVALPVDPGAWFEAKVTGAPHGVRVFAPSDLHVTVAFLGPVDEAAAARGWEALSWGAGAIDATLGAVVGMGSPRRPSAYSALFDRGRPELEAGIAASRDAVYAAAGARPDERPAKAHLTLARPGRSASATDRAAGLRWAEGLSLSGTPVRLDRAALFTWTEERSHGLFRIVADRPLDAEAGRSG